MKPQEPLRRVAEKILGRKAGRAFLARLEGDVMFDGLRAPAPIAVRAVTADTRRLARERLDQLAKNARRVADALELLKGRPPNDSDFLAAAELWEAVPCDGARLEALAAQILAVAGGAAAASQRLKPNNRPTDVLRRNLLLVIITAYQEATGAPPVADKNFLALVDAVFADRDLRAPSPKTVRAAIEPRE